jgi:hypothetical protein
LVAGCQTKTASTGPRTEELRLLTPEQEKKLAELTERTEQKELVTQVVKNGKGDVVATIKSQTTVIFLKPSAGGGGFSVNETCTSTCAGTPIVLDPGKTTQENSCHCNAACDSCAGAVDSQGCTGTCTKSKTGFGNFGIFIASTRESAPETLVARR